MGDGARADAIPVPPGEFQDRSLGLVIFACLEFLIAAYLIVQGAPVAMYWIERDWGWVASVLPWLILDLVLRSLEVAFLVAMGVGTVLGRRWARSLMFVASWAWLYLGLVDVAKIVLWWWGYPDTEYTDPQLTVRMVVTFLESVVAPCVFLFFYGNRHVRAMCEYEDPRERWTDRYPLPVLPAAVLLFLAALETITSCTTDLQIKLFGSLLLGQSRIAPFVVLAVIQAVVGWLILRVQRIGLWGAIALCLAGAVSSVMGSGYFRPDLTLTGAGLFWGVFASMERWQRQLPVLTSFLFGCLFVCYLGYLIWLRRYFPRPRR